MKKLGLLFVIIFSLSTTFVGACNWTCGWCNCHKKKSITPLSQNPQALQQFRQDLQSGKLTMRSFFPKQKTKRTLTRSFIPGKQLDEMDDDDDCGKVQKRNRYRPQNKRRNVEQQKKILYKKIMAVQQAVSSKDGHNISRTVGDMIHHAQSVMSMMDGNEQKYVFDTVNLFLNHSKSNGPSRNYQPYIKNTVLFCGLLLGSAEAIYHLLVALGVIPGESNYSKIFEKIPLYIMFVNQFFSKKNNGKKLKSGLEWGMQELKKMNPNFQGDTVIEVDGFDGENLDNYLD